MIALLLYACTVLAPYERSLLMTPVMQEAATAGEAAVEAHVDGTREPASGADGETGASCGCT